MHCMKFGQTEVKPTCFKYCILAGREDTIPSKFSGWQQRSDAFNEALMSSNNLSRRCFSSNKLLYLLKTSPVPAQPGALLSCTVTWWYIWTVPHQNAHWVCGGSLWRSFCALGSFSEWFTCFLWQTCRNITSSVVKFTTAIAKQTCIYIYTEL